jgi:hypothetical protein
MRRVQAGDSDYAGMLGQIGLRADGLKNTVLPPGKKISIVKAYKCTGCLVTARNPHRIRYRVTDVISTSSKLPAKIDRMGQELKELASDIENLRAMLADLDSEIGNAKDLLGMGDRPSLLSGSGVSRLDPRVLWGSNDLAIMNALDRASSDWALQSVGLAIDYQMTNELRQLQQRRELVLEPLVVRQARELTLIEAFDGPP